MFGHYLPFALPLNPRWFSLFLCDCSIFGCEQWSSVEVCNFCGKLVMINQQINFTLAWVAWLVCLLFFLADEYIKKRARKSHSKVVHYFSKTTLFFNFDRVLLFTLFYGSRNFIQLSKINIHWKSSHVIRYSQQISHKGVAKTTF